MAPVKRKRKALSVDEQRVRKWITERRGVLTSIAVQCDVSAQFVQQIAYARSTALPGHRAESMLRDLGWTPPRKG